MQTKDRYTHGSSAIRKNSNNRFRQFYPLIVGILIGVGWLIFGILLFIYQAIDQLPSMLFYLSIVLVILALIISLMYCSKHITSLSLVLLASLIIFLVFLSTLSVLSMNVFSRGAAGGKIIILWFVLVPIATYLLWAGIIIVATHRPRIYLLLFLLPHLSIPYTYMYYYILLGIICVIIGIVVYWTEPPSNLQLDKR